MFTYSNFMKENFHPILPKYRTLVLESGHLSLEIFDEFLFKQVPESQRDVHSGFRVPTQTELEIFPSLKLATQLNEKFNSSPSLKNIPKSAGSEVSSFVKSLLNKDYIKKKKKNIGSSIFLICSQVLQWICLCLKTTGSSVPLELLQYLCYRLFKIAESRGIAWTILYCKAIRGNLMSYFSNNPIKDPLVKCTVDGIPIVLGGLIPHIRGRSYIVISMVFTILLATRALSIGKIPNFEPIIAPSKEADYDLSKHMEDFWRAIGYRPAIHGKPWSLRVLLKNLETFSTKSGPNGHALNTSVIDASLMPQSLIDSLVIMGGPKIGAVLRKLREPVITEFCNSVIPILSDKPRKYGIRRLTWFGDKENKVRVIALFDYWSQIVLKPFFIYLTNALKKIPQDCTLDQGKFRELLKNKDHRHMYHSIDLSNATDRFPISLQVQLLKKQLPDAYIDAWKDVMVGYPFIVNPKGSEKNLIDKDQTFSYSVGTPMGGYTSFHSFALTHHYIIFHCCKELGLDWRSLPYCLLGDDIVIGHDDVAKKYKEILILIGVDFSAAKTHSSYFFYEFAKRLILDETEISPFPISAMPECGKSFVMMTTLLHELRVKGWIFPSISDSVGLFFGVVRQKSSTFQKKVVDKSWRLEGVLKTIQGVIPAHEFLIELMRRHNLPTRQINIQNAKALYEDCVWRSFRKSNPYMLDIQKGTLSYSQIPLGGFAIRLYTLWDQFKIDYIKENGPLPNSLLSFTCQDLPWAMAAKATIRLYEDMSKKVLEVMKTGGEWPLTLQRFALPRDDKSLLDRNNFVKAMVAAHLSEIIEDSVQFDTGLSTLTRSGISSRVMIVR